MWWLVIYPLCPSVPREHQVISSLKCSELQSGWMHNHQKHVLSPQKLANSKAHTSRFISANLPCNKFKNRLVNIMPFESTRVCLQPIRGVEGSDYINASFIDGYRWAHINHVTEKCQAQWQTEGEGKPRTWVTHLTEAPSECWWVLWQSPWRCEIMVLLGLHLCRLCACHQGSG